jgi:hypothetical protein
LEPALSGQARTALIHFRFTPLPSDAQSSLPVLFLDRSVQVYCVAPEILPTKTPTVLGVSPNNSLQGTRLAHLWLAALGAIVLARP